MTRIKTPNQKKLYDSLNERLDGYENATDTLLNGYNERVAVLVATSNPIVTADKPFTFSSSSNKPQLDNVMREAKMAIYAQILANTKKEWKNSNKVQDKLVDTSIKRYVSDEQAEEYYNDNEDELTRFQERSDDGLTVYGRVDNHVKKYKSCLEASLSLALLAGASFGASYLLSRIKRGLTNFQELKKSYAKQYGEKKNLYDARYYINRLVRSEANMAYRRAELLRWQQWDFIIGYRICLSPGHKVNDICDDLKGNYPKSFIWTGWHPNDRCFCIPILQSKESLINGEEAVNITDVPSQFKTYVRDQHDNILSSANKGTLAYYLRDNKDFWKKIFSKKELKAILSKIKKTETFADRVKVKLSKAKFSLYGDDWEKAVFDNKTGGYNVYHKEHKFSKGKSKGASLSGGDAEKVVGNLLAKQGKKVEFLPENSKYKQKCADIRFDKQTWDIKYISTANEETIRGYIKDAAKADNAIFYWDGENKLELLQSATKRCIGSFKKDKKIMPDIYYINKKGELKNLYKK